jgi:hypothetical protein
MPAPTTTEMCSFISNFAVSMQSAIADLQAAMDRQYMPQEWHDKINAALTAMNDAAVTLQTSCFIIQ